MAYDSDGVIRQTATDVSTLVPDGLSVVELKPESVPPALNIDGRWRFDGEKVVPELAFSPPGG